MRTTEPHPWRSRSLPDDDALRVDLDGRSWLNECRFGQPRQWQADEDIKDVRPKTTGDGHVSEAHPSNNNARERIGNRRARGENCQAHDDRRNAEYLADRDGPPHHAVREHRNPEEAHEEGDEVVPLGAGLRTVLDCVHEHYIDGRAQEEQDLRLPVAIGWPDQELVVVIVIVVAVAALAHELLRLHSAAGELAWNSGLLLGQRGVDFLDSSGGGRAGALLVAFRLRRTESERLQLGVPFRGRLFGNHLVVLPAGLSQATRGARLQQACGGRLAADGAAASPPTDVRGSLYPGEASGDVPFWAVRAPHGLHAKVLLRAWFLAASVVGQVLGVGVGAGRRGVPRHILGNDALEWNVVLHDRHVAAIHDQQDCGLVRLNLLIAHKERKHGEAEDVVGSVPEQGPPC
eukprot:scaffold1954_cov268-Pinguiococcus_pyrenoidosus.AAC.109